MSTIIQDTKSTEDTLNNSAFSPNKSFNRERFSSYREQILFTEYNFAKEDGNRKKCKEIEDHLINMYQSLIAKFAIKGAAYYHVSKAEMYSELCICFLKAIRGYDASFNSKFITYAYHKLSGGLLSYCNKFGLYKGSINRQRRWVRNLYDRGYSVDEICEKTRYSKKRVTTMLDGTHIFRSLDVPVGAAGVNKLSDMIADNHAESSCFDDEDMALLKKARDFLSERQKRISDRLFNNDSLVSISREVQVTVQTVASERDFILSFYQQVSKFSDRFDQFKRKDILNILDCLDKETKDLILYIRGSGSFDKVASIPAKTVSLLLNRFEKILDYYECHKDTFKSDLANLIYDGNRPGIISDIKHILGVEQVDGIQKKRKSTLVNRFINKNQDQSLFKALFVKAYLVRRNKAQ